MSTHEVKIFDQQLRTEVVYITGVFSAPGRPTHIDRMFILQIMLLEQQIRIWVNKFSKPTSFFMFVHGISSKKSFCSKHFAIFSVLNPESLPWLDNWPETTRKMFFVNERGFLMA